LLPNLVSFSRDLLRLLKCLVLLLLLFLSGRQLLPLSLVTLSLLLVSQLLPHGFVFFVDLLPLVDFPLDFALDLLSLFLD
jgi:hypothetical protein